MISDILMAFVFYFLRLVASPLLLLGDATLDPNVQASLSNIMGYIELVDLVFPVATMFACLGVFLAFEVALFSYKGIMWLIRKIPTIS
jgi:hypothetical protein